MEVVYSALRYRRWGVVGLGGVLRQGLGPLPVCEGPSQTEPLPPCPPGTERNGVCSVTTPVKERGVLPKGTASMNQANRF